MLCVCHPRSGERSYKTYPRSGERSYKATHERSYKLLDVPWFSNCLRSQAIGFGIVDE
jgi:hypothetical protein